MGLKMGIVKLKLRLSRVDGYIGQVKMMILWMMALKIFGLEELIVPSCVSILVGIYLIGWLDERYGIWKEENLYSTVELNPFFKELDRRIRKIEER